MAASVQGAEHTGSKFKALFHGLPNETRATVCSTNQPKEQLQVQSVVLIYHRIAYLNISISFTVHTEYNNLCPFEQGNQIH